jgi:hypothetical protein
MLNSYHVMYDLKLLWQLNSAKYPQTVSDGLCNRRFGNDFLPLMMETKMSSETVVSFEHVTLLEAREDFIKFQRKLNLFNGAVRL